MSASLVCMVVWVGASCLMGCLGGWPPCLVGCLGRCPLFDGFFGCLDGLPLFDGLFGCLHVCVAGAR